MLLSHFVVPRETYRTAFRRVARLWIALVSLAAAGCGEEVDPRPTSWGYIHAAIVVPTCATIGCHSDFSEQGNLNLEEEQEGYDELLNSLPRRVVPGNPAGSLLMVRLQGIGGQRMPPDAPLPAADVELIGRWIENGAAR
jgi:Planctomycete cytochrome C